MRGRRALAERFCFLVPWQVPTGGACSQGKARGECVTILLGRYQNANETLTRQSTRFSKTRRRTRRPLDEQLSGDARNVRYAAGLFKMLKTGSDSVIGPKLSYIVMLWPGIDKEALDLYSRTFEIKIPEMYVSFLQQMNGAIPFGMSLCGVPLSMLGDPPLLDRTVVQCHDLATAAKDWITEYRVAARLFHFGFRYFSETENVGYFIDQGKRIKCIKESGKVVGWD